LRLQTYSNILPFDRVTLTPDCCFIPNSIPLRMSELLNQHFVRAFLSARTVFFDQALARSRST
jgi:hypothetical protein